LTSNILWGKMFYMSEKQSTRTAWAKVNIHPKRYEEFKEVAKQTGLSVPVCVDKAAELWLREMAPKLIGLLK
jgi:hypothetical protein